LFPKKNVDKHRSLLYLNPELIRPTKWSGLGLENKPHSIKNPLRKKELLLGHLTS
jgi:hypothetical protein